MTKQTEPIAPLPCPYCGGRTELLHREGYVLFACQEGSSCRGSHLLTSCVTVEHLDKAVAQYNKRTPQPTPDYAVAIERAAEVCEEARTREVRSARDYTESFMPNLARDHTIRADELGHVVEAIRALMPAGVEVFESDGTISVEAI